MRKCCSKYVPLAVPKTGTIAGDPESFRQDLSACDFVSKHVSSFEKPLGRCVSNLFLHSSEASTWKLKYVYDICK